MAAQVVLATAGYDHTIRFWEATSGICYRTLQFNDAQVRPDSVEAAHPPVKVSKGTVVCKYMGPKKTRSPVLFLDYK